MRELIIFLDILSFMHEYPSESVNQSLYFKSKIGIYLVKKMRTWKKHIHDVELATRNNKKKAKRSHIFCNENCCQPVLLKEAFCTILPLP